MASRRSCQVRGHDLPASYQARLRDAPERLVDLCSIHAAQGVQVNKVTKLVALEAVDRSLVQVADAG